MVSWADRSHRIYRGGRGPWIVAGGGIEVELLLHLQVRLLGIGHDRCRKAHTILSDLGDHIRHVRCIGATSVELILGYPVMLTTLLAT